MDFSSISRQSRLGKLLRLPLRLIPPGTVVPIIQGPLRGMKWIASSTNHGYWLGSHEYDKQRLFARSVFVGSVVFDIGANVGFYTLLASKKTGPSGYVYAFEPVPRNLEYLKAHLRLNRMTNVTVIPSAVSDSSGEMSFDEGLSPSTGRISSQGRLYVEAIALDDIISRNEARIPNILKIDVEGGELAVLQGARRLLIEHQPNIFLATHGVKVHQECCLYLEALGYHLHSLEKGTSVEQARELLAE